MKKLVDINKRSLSKGDMIKCLIMPEATYVEGTINLEESGDYTNDNSINEYLLAS